MLAKKLVKNLPRAVAAAAAAWAFAPSFAFAADSKNEIGMQASPDDPTQKQPQADPASPSLSITPEGVAAEQPTQSPAAKDTTVEDAPKPAEAAPPKPRPFSGTQVFLQTAMSTATVIKDQQLDYNPTVDQSVFMLPRFAINKDWQLRGRLLFVYEYTNSDSTKTNHEPRFSDTSVQLFYRGIPAFAGIKPLVGAQLALPTSPESRARTMYMAPGLSAQLVKSFEHIGNGEITVIGGANYSHPLYRYTTPGVRNETPYAFQCFGASASCDGQLTGNANASDSLSFSAIVVGEWGHWSPALFYLSSHQWAYTFSDQPGVTRLEDRTNVRQSSYFSTWLDYNFNTWLTGEVGYFMQRNVLSESGKYGNPFFDRNQDMRVYLGANINIDSFVQTVFEKDKADGGVVRAKNRRSPALAF